MSKRALILVEGQTEERFVKDVLAPAFWEKGLFFSATILTTKRVKDGPSFKGGMTISPSSVMTHSGCLTARAEHW